LDKKKEASPRTFTHGPEFYYYVALGCCNNPSVFLLFTVLILKHYIISERAELPTAGRLLLNVLKEASSVSL
jgi:hypothetical protein